MRKLSLNILFLILVIGAMGQVNPHGEGLVMDCGDCHTTKGWSYIATSRFNHDSTQYILEGQHKYADCAACHKSLVFSDTRSNCIDCHDDLHNTTLGSDCAGCHTSDSWIVTNITELHQQSRFPLLGAHNTADCSSCHVSASQLEFEPLGVECVDCHMQDYLAASRPNHVATNLSTDCSECHEIAAMDWTASGDSHAFFPLTQGHNIDCSACHTGDLTEPLSPECYSCHEENYNEAENHVLLGYPTDCEFCHTIATWEQSTFDHNATAFPLSGAHISTECLDCHSEGYIGTATECIDCHSDNYNSAKDHIALGYPSDCLICHNTSNWEQSTFDHNATAFPLSGAHKATECIACHANGYTGTPTECSACHTNKYNEAQNPNHTEPGISTECETCHTTTVWTPSTFNHLTSTGFALTGGHAVQQCSECHVGTTSGASSECISCHQTDYNTAKDHVSQNYPTECILCHTTNNWDKSTFDHNVTAFPLTGAHKATECKDCHTDGYTGTPTECSACHTNNYNTATDPDHKTAGISTECETCHTTTAWKPSTFNHNSTGFVLTGGHAGRQCSDCHIGTTSGASSDCISCHQSDYNSALEHVSQSFPQNCLLCHNTSNWSQITFDHNTSRFPLTGSHRALSCSACHSSGYVGTPTDCKSCHTTDYNNANDPNHVAAGISKNCETCHGTTSWTSSTFNHTTSTGFALTGGHANRQCSDCHMGTTSGASSECISCHRTDYNGAQDPDHRTAGVSVSCETCHGTTSWTPSTFNHTASTGFALTGGHANRQCSDCHIGTTSDASSDCISCHQANYTQARDHVAQNFPFDCLLCHNTTDWGQSTFDHNATSFPLNGAHIATECIACHSQGYTNTPTDCSYCHMEEYNNTVNPNHAALGFSTDCSSCHTENAWDPSTFDHDNLYFPIYSGKHNGEWDSCTDCHKEPSNPLVFTCTDCHEHGILLMGVRHLTVQDYDSNSTSCFECHPNGEVIDE